MDTTCTPPESKRKQIIQGLKLSQEFPCQKRTGAPEGSMSVCLDGALIIRRNSPDGQFEAFIAPRLGYKPSSGGRTAFVTEGSI